MNKLEFINEISKRTGYSKTDVKQVIDTTFEVISDTLANGNDITISGFGKFATKTRKPRIGYNFKTGEKMNVGEVNSISFKASAVLKDKVNN